MSRFAIALAACLLAVPALAVTIQKPDTEASTGEKDYSGDDFIREFLNKCPTARDYYVNIPSDEFMPGIIDTLSGTAESLQVQVDDIRIEFPNPNLATTIPSTFTGTYWLAVEPLDIAAIYEGTGAECKLLMKPSRYTELPAP